MSMLALYHLVLFFYSSAGALKIANWIEKKEFTGVTFFVTFVGNIALYCWINSTLFSAYVN